MTGGGSAPTPGGAPIDMGIEAGRHIGVHGDAPASELTAAHRRAPQAV